MINDWIDISVLLHTDMAHWPDNPPVRIETVGVDYLAVGGYTKDGVETHRALLEAGIWIIEGLDLSQVQPGTYELICLPLKVAKSDGAPARAIIRKAGGDQ